MMTTRQPTRVMEIYNEYVRLRRTGSTLDQVVGHLRGVADQLADGERNQLNSLVQTWEMQQNTLTPQPKAKVSVIRPIQPIAHRHVIQAQEARVVCPSCGKSTPKSGGYCYACGQPLNTKPSSTKIFPEREALNSQPEFDPAFFGADSQLLILVRGTPRLVHLRTEGETIIGRCTADSAMNPDIDLAEYDAENLGVSRLHSSLSRDKNTVRITDLDSRNFTYINGQRLYPHEVRVLRDGDEIRLGKLVLRVAFKR